MWTRSQVVLAASGLVAVLAAPVALEVGSRAQSSTLLPGCAADRVAVAFHADGSSADGTGAPITCATNTGYGGAETAVSVAPNGDLVVEPAILSPGLAGTGIIDNAIFRDLVTKYTEDTKAKEQGGDLRYFTETSTDSGWFRFSVARLGPGRYRITFDVAFPVEPTVIVTNVFGAFAIDAGTSVKPRENGLVDQILTTSTLVATGDDAGNRADKNFCFIALGPR